ncbi:MAG: stalk domain-containing protein [Bacillota bacterium]|nr:stalk domain-containing protein [Bacillota bacterium]
MTKKLIMVMVIVLAVVTASFATTKAMDIAAQLDPEIRVSLDGKVLDLKSPDGQKVNVVVYNGTTYLPVRAVSNALGLQVDWDQATRTVILKSSTNNQGTNTNTGATQPAPATQTKIGDVVFKNDKVIIKYAGLDLDVDNDDDEIEVKFIVENLTKEKYNLTVVDTKLNAKAVPSKLHDDEDIDKLEKEDVEIEFKKAELKKAGIMKMENLEFKFKLDHKTAPFETPVIKVNF